VRYTPGEDYETWAQKAKQSELDRARQLLITETDVDKILVSLSDRLTEKLLHPLTKQIQQEYLDCYQETGPMEKS
jgi:glutamyl-tRNA reductase